MGSTPRERAADIHAAFADPGIKAVIASIGGDDQITVLPYLDRELIRANPKPFFGMSDNTNLLAFLRTLRHRRLPRRERDVRTGPPRRHAPADRRVPARGPVHPGTVRVEARRAVA